MSQVTAPSASHEPGLSTVEMVCERLGELGLPVGPDTARELVRAILELETPRVEAHVRDAIETFPGHDPHRHAIRAGSPGGHGATATPSGSARPAETRARRSAQPEDAGAGLTRTGGPCGGAQAEGGRTIG